MTLTEKKRGPSLLILGCLFSLFVHWGLFLWKFAADHALTPASDTAIEVADIDPRWLEEPEPAPTPAQKARRRAMEVVRSQKAKEQAAPDPNAQFLGEQNQTVEKEVRVKEQLTDRDEGGTGEKVEAKPTPAETAATMDSPLDLADQTVEKKNLEDLSLKDLGISGDGLPLGGAKGLLDGVEEGKRTLLSTREIKYHSFYSRMSDMIRRHWLPTVRSRLDRYWRMGKTIRKDELNTVVKVLMDSQGKVAKIARVASSGVEEVDLAAHDAIQRASPFPNPPDGLVEGDGLVRVEWTFTLTLSSAPVLRFQNAGTPPPP